jgi:hypothetical protein
MVLLRITELAMAVAAEDCGFVAEGLARNVVALQTMRIRFPATAADRMVCAEAQEGVAEAALGAVVDIAHE